MASSQTAKTSNIDEDNEEEESWIPLSEEEEGNRKPPVASSYGAEGNPSATTQNERIQAIQQRLETRLQLKKNLVNHPIELFWKRYLFNLAREFWGLEFYIQLGLSMILTGILLKIFLLSTWYIWYPKMAFLSVLFIVSLVYLDPFEIRIQINEIRKIIFSPDKAAEALEQLDMKQLRRLSLLLLMIPTALEVKTLSFLSQIKAESGWALYNTLLAFAILYLMMYLKRAKHLKPRECSYQGLLVLYGSALLVTIVKTDLGRMPVLAAPFFTATGTLLITYRDDDIEWFSRVLRHALRLTLRDVLSSVSEKVSQDEMLQLTILRWIADYWAYTPDNPASQTNDAPGGSRPKDTQSSQTPHSAPQPNTQSASSRPTPTQQTANDMGPRRRPNSLRFPRHEVQWEELLPMLNVAADHMASEVHILQSSNGTKNNPGIGNSNTENTTSSNRAGSPLSGGHDCDHEGLDNLKAMLMSLNVDEGARPAVMAYRRAVESFPPKKKTAVIISVLRRCPAMITLLWHCVFGSRSLFSSTMLILPFIFFEYYRIKEWISACEQITFFYGSGVERDESWGIPQELAEAEVMTILLCGDSPSIVRPPTLLLVWRNIVSSVSSLEIGLTTARCAQTTVVAVDFAGNMMSLMQFGFEVKEHGWLHGIATLTKEFISMNSADYNSTGQRRRGGETKYTNAAMGAVHNAQVVARNVQSLSEDENLQPVLQHVLGTLTVMCGYGWLWGNGESDSGKERTEVNSGAEDTTPDHGNSSTDEPSANDRTTREDTGKEQVDEPVAHEIPKTPGAKHASNELSEVMDMVAQAYEQGLINEAEKNEFCEKLSSLSNRELFDPSVVAGIKRTLLIVLQDIDASGTDEWHLTEISRLDTEIDHGQETECKGREAEVLELQEIKPSADMTSKEVSQDVDPNEVESTIAKPIPVAISSTVATPLNQTPTGETISGKVQTTTEKKMSVTRSTQGGNLSVENPRVETEEGSTEEGNNPWVKFGMAALGVVAGGVLLSMQGGNNGNRSEDGEETDQRNESSTVKIEELKDDNEDEWVSIPKSN